MKNSIKTLKLLSLALVSIFLFNCSKDDDTTPVTPLKTIAGIVQSNANFSSLLAALNKADLTSTLNSPGTYTVFAPTNTAFSAFLAANNFANLDAVPVPALKEILLNHVLTTKSPSSLLSTGYVKTLAKGTASATNTLSMYINTTNGVRINNVSSVSQADIEASNGIVHVVDAVIGLPTIVTHATANSSFSSLVAALTRAGNTTNFVTALSAPGPFTVFAPTNTAFTSFLSEINLTLPNIPEPTLDRVLKYHVVSGANVLSTGLPTAPNNVIATLAGTTAVNQITILLGPPRITDSRNRTANITAVDVQCANGVIHVLDKVLFPQ